MRLSILAIALVSNFFAYAQNQNVQTIENAVRIKFKSDLRLEPTQNEFVAPSSTGYLAFGNDALDQLNERYRATTMKRVFPYAGKFEEKHRKHGLHLWYDIYVAPGTTVASLVDQYGSLDVISLAEPLAIYNNEAFKGEVLSANDPRLSEQWHYENTGQSGGLSGADISLKDAWDIEAGDSRVVVSVHDSGIDLYHPDLNDHIWINEGEIADDGIDNDNNGFVDDYYGYNFAAAAVGGDPTDVYDYGGHGTHTSGTIAAENNNGVGVGGVAGGTGSGDGVRIMMLRLGDDYGSPYIYNPAPSFVYAADMGSVISSNSWGGGGYSQSIYDAITYYVTEAGGSGTGLNGGLVVFSSGNSSSSYEDYKASIENVLMVSATNHNDQKAWYSNYGTWVDISAPGGETSSASNQGVLSTLPDNSYAFYQGTSMACPHVSGVAALLVSKAFGTGLTNTQLFDAIVSNADPIDDLNPYYVGLLGSGRLNARAALDAVADGGGSGGDLILDPLVIDAEIKEDASETYTIRLVNTSAFDLEVDITEDASWLTTDAVNISIAPNAVAKFEIELTSTTPGEFLQTNLVLSYVSFSSKTDRKLPISMYTLGQPEIYAQDSLHFNMNYQGYTVTQNLVVNNTGTNYLEITEAVNTHDDYTVQFDNTTIAPGDSSIFPVDFTPTSPGLILDSILFTTNDPDNAAFKVVLEGSGNPNDPPMAQIDPAEINFELQSPTYGTETFSITNMGDDELSYVIQANPYKNIPLSNLTKRAWQDPNDQEIKDQAHDDPDNSVNSLGDLVEYIESPVDIEMGMAWDGEYLWIAEASSPNIYRFDVNSQTITDTIFSIAEEGVKLDFDGEFLWEHDYGSQLIKYALDGEVLLQIPLDETINFLEGIACDPDGIWMASNNFFIKIDAESGEVIERFENYYAYYAESIESIGNKLFIMSNGRIYEINKGSNSYSRSTSYIAGYPNMETEDLSFDGRHAWVSFTNYDVLLKIDLFSDFIHSVYPNSGSLAGGETASIQVDYDLSYFDNGLSYSDELLVETNAIENSDHSIPVIAFIKGTPRIDLSRVSLSLDSYIGYTSSDTLIMSNKGNEKLTVSNISTSGSDFSLGLTTAEILPYESVRLPVSVALTTTDTVYATLTIESNDPLNPTAEVSLKAIGRYAPEISVDLEAIDLTLYESQIDSVKITITNSGEGDLMYYIQNNPFDSLATNTVASTSQTFSGMGPVLTSKDQSDNEFVSEVFTSKPVPSNTTTQTNPGDLEEILSLLNENYSAITSLIPDKFDFSDGASGYSISDGGNDMYDGGNYLSTDHGGYIDYTNAIITASSYFGNEDYFTAKYPGLFVLSANLSEVNNFYISGNLGADGSGSVDGSVLSITFGGVEYLGFVKRVYNAGDPSVNHLIIVPNNGNVYHTFDTYSDYDDHYLHDMYGIGQMHYLLFAGNNGGYINDEAMLSIMDAFLNTLGLGVDLQVLGPNQSVSDHIVFDATGLAPGQYNYDVLVETNDPVNPKINIPTALEVRSSAVLNVSSDFISFGNAYVGAHVQKRVDFLNAGTDTLYIAEYNLTGGEQFSLPSSLPDTIAPGESDYLFIEFLPTVVETYAGQVVIHSNDSLTAERTIELTGTGTPSAILSLSPRSMADTLDLGSSGDYTTTVTNAGTEALSYRIIIEETVPLNLLIEGVEDIRKQSGIYDGGLVTKQQTTSDGTIIPSRTITDPEEIAGYTTSTGGKNILILAAEDGYAIQHVVDALENSGSFGFIAYINTSNTSGDFLNHLKYYDAVLIWKNYPHNDPLYIGNSLADYVDAGGGVVTTLFQNTSNSLTGRWSEQYEKYSLYNTSDFGTHWGYDYAYMAELPNPDHPLVNNVDTLNGGYYSFRTNATSDMVSDQATLVASWHDGSPLIVAGDVEGVRRVDLGFYPISDALYSGYWSADTDGIQILVNALNYVAHGIAGSEADWITASTYRVDSLGAGENIDLELNVNTEGFDEGWKAARVDFYSNDSRGIKLSYYMDIFGEGTEELSISDSLDFETTTFGFAKAKRLPIRNLGDGATEIVVEIDSLSDFNVSLQDTVTVRPYNALYANITFTPSRLGDYTDTLVIRNIRSNETKEVVLLAKVLPPGKIRIEPSEIELTVGYKDEIDSEFTIHNHGEGDLNFVLDAFHLPSQLSGTTLNNTSYLEFDAVPDKGTPDTRTGHPVLLGMGEDDFGYTYIDSREENGPEYQWNDISATGTEVTLDDDESTLVELPFELPFYGLRKTALFVTSNGLIGLNHTGISSPINSQIPDNATPNGFIAPFWKDLAPNNGGKIYYEINNEKIIVQYQSVPDYDGTGSFTFQVIIYKSGDLMFLYEDMNGLTTDATIGLEHENGNQGLQIAFNSDYVADQLAIHIAHPVLQINPETTIGTILPGDSLTIPFTYQSLDDLGGWYNRQISIISNDTASALSVVDLSVYVEGISSISAFKDTLSFDSTYISRVSAENMWFKNDSVGVLYIQEVISAHEDFAVAFPHYIVHHSDTLGFSYTLNLNTGTGSIFGEIQGLEDELLAVKIYQKTDDRKTEISNVRTTSLDDGSYELSGHINLDNEQLWSLIHGELFVDVFTTDHLAGKGAQPLVSSEIEVLPYEYSKAFYSLYKPTTDRADTSIFSVVSNAINTDDLKPVAFGVGLKSNVTVALTIDELNESLMVSDSSTQQFTISNEGVDSLYFSLRNSSYKFESNLNPIELSGASNRTQRKSPSVNPNDENQWRVPASEVAEMEDKGKSSSVVIPEGGSYFYGNMYSNSSESFSYASIADPSHAYSLLETENNFSMATEFVYGSSSRVLVLDLAGNLWLTDLETETTTFLNYIGSGSWTGMTTDPRTGKVYISTISSLYELNIETYSITYIGSFNHNWMVGIALDSEGLMFGYTLNDELVKIDPYTGSSEYIGYIGFDAGYGQDMAFNSETDEFYMAAFNVNTLRAELRLVDKETGSTTLIGPIGTNLNNAQMASIAFPVSGNRFFAVDIRGGALAPGESIDITAAFNATDLANGKHSSMLTLASNDLSNPQIKIPVTLRVEGNMPRVGSYTNEINFGLRTVKDSVYRTAQIENIGKEVLELVLKNEGEGFHSPYQVGDSLRIDVGQSADIPIWFIPDSTGVFELDMTWETNDTLQSTVIVSLAGGGKRADQELSLSFFSYELELPIRDKTTLDLVLSSTGSDTVTYTLELLEDLPWISTDSVASALAPDASDTFLITINTEAIIVGDYIANILVQSNDPMYDRLEIPVSLRVSMRENLLVAIGESEEPLSIALADHFFDNEQDSLNYTVDVSAGHIEAMISNDTVRISGITHGIDTLTIVARDLQGDSLVTQLFVMSNTRPAISEELPDVKTWLGNSTMELADLNDYFSDPDGHTLTYEVSHSDSIADVLLISGDELIIKVKQIGTEEVVITAWDGYHLQSQSFELLIHEPLNITPEWSKSFKAYPNPVDNDLTIDLTLSKTQNLNLEILDVVGRQMLTLEIDVNAGKVSKNIDLSDFRPGVYLIRISSGNDGVLMHRFIKK